MASRCLLRLAADEKQLLRQRPHLNGLSGAPEREPSPLGWPWPSSPADPDAEAPCFLIWWRSQLDLVVNHSGQDLHLRK